jgi:hypothetical protein
VGNQQATGSEGDGVTAAHQFRLMRANPTTNRGEQVDAMALTQAAQWSNVLSVQGR